MINVSAHAVNLSPIVNAIAQGQTDTARHLLRAVFPIPQLDDALLSDLLALSNQLDDDELAQQLLGYSVANPACQLARISAYCYAKQHGLITIAQALWPEVKYRLQQRPELFANYRSLPLLFLAEPNSDSAFNLWVHQQAFQAQQSKPPTKPIVAKPRPKLQRPLRVGIVSGDLRQHSLGQLIQGFYAHHDPALLHLYSFYTGAQQDALTQWFKQASQAFIPCHDLDLASLAACIASHEIDILLDLSGFTQDSAHRVTQFSPAGMHISYLGYPFTSGHDCIDYYLCDEILWGEHSAAYFSERPLFIAGGFVSRAAGDIDVPRRPANQEIVLGCLNSPYKFSVELLQAWCEILPQLPQTKLKLAHPKLANPSTIMHLHQFFHAQGVATKRIEYLTTNPKAGHLAHYANMDIALDTFPVTGGTTTLDALRMSVPVVTRSGEVVYQRASESILRHSGLDVSALIAADTEAYIARVVDLVNHPTRLRTYQDTLYTQAKTTALFHPVQHATALQTALIAAWEEGTHD